VREIAEHLDQAKSLAHEHHILTESSEATEIGPVGATPICQAPVAFALIVRKGGVNFIEAPIGYFGGFDGTARFTTPVEHDPALTECRGVRLVFRAAGGGLDAFDHEFKQLICEFGTVAEGERPEVLIPFRDRLAHGLPSFRERLAFGAMEANTLAVPVPALQVPH